VDQEIAATTAAASEGASGHADTEESIEEGEMKREKTLPVVLAEEQRMIDIVAEQLTPRLREWISATVTEEWIEATLLSYLCLGLVEALDIIAIADKGDPIADAVLRRHIAELTDAGIDPGKTLTAYGIKALLRGPVERGQGHYWSENWRRDIAASCMVFLAEQHFNLKPTRNRKQARRGEPSASSVTSGALGRIGINVAEKTVENIHSGVQGDVAAFIRSRVLK
jgi:hypothetical protein